MNILLCCSTGMSTSILVREMRDIIQKKNLDYKIAAISVGKVDSYIEMADIVLVAPQCIAFYDRIYTIAKKHNIPVVLIGREEYGMMNGKKIIEILKYQKIRMEVMEMNQFSSALEAKLMPLMNKVSRQRHLNSIRNALIATIPLTVLGAVFILLANLPFPRSYVDFMAANPHIVQALLVPFRMTIGLLSIYVAYGIGLNLAKSYDLDGHAGALSALVTFFVTLNFSTAPELGSVLRTQFLGGQGLFTAILCAILAVEVMRFCVQKNIVIKMPSQVPPNVGNSFSALIPITISVTIVWLIVHVFGIDINHLIATIITPLLSMSANSILAPIVFAVLTAVMWFFGMHPAILAAIMDPIWLINAEANMLAAAAGEIIPNIGVRPFVFTFLWIGGGGGTLSLCILMCMSKSKVIKSLGRLSIVPSIFNINEPILFGLPIVLNPIMIIPFILGPVICTFVTFSAFYFGIVPGMGYPLAAVWTMPAVLAGVVATASISGGILVLVNMLIYGAVYYPFFKILEKRAVLVELEGDKEVTA